MYYVYVIRGGKANKIYTGLTNNLIKRLKEHNLGMVKATKNQRPLKLLYYEASNVLEDAAKREKSLKTGFGRAYLKRRLSDI